MRIATDKDWQMDVRNGPESWKTDLDQQHQCKHYLYRGEAIFYGTYSVRRQDLSLSFSNFHRIFQIFFEEENYNQNVTYNVFKGLFL